MDILPVIARSCAVVIEMPIMSKADAKQLKLQIAVSTFLRLLRLEGRMYCCAILYWIAMLQKGLYALL